MLACMHDFLSGRFWRLTIWLTIQKSALSDHCMIINNFTESYCRHLPIIKAICQYNNCQLKALKLRHCLNLIPNPNSDLNLTTLFLKLLHPRDQPPS